MNLQADVGMCQQGCQRGHTTSCQPLVLRIKTPHFPNISKNEHFVGIQSPCQMMSKGWIISKNVRYLASNTILRFGDWGSLGIHILIFEVFSWGNPWKTSISLPFCIKFPSNWRLLSSKVAAAPLRGVDLRNKVGDAAMGDGGGFRCRKLGDLMFFFIPP